MRLLSLLLALAALAGLSYYVVEQYAASSTPDGPSAPKQQLDRVREQAKAMEKEAQRRADQAVKKSE